MKKDIFDTLMEDHQELRYMMDTIIASRGSAARKAQFDAFEEELDCLTQAKTWTLYQYMISEKSVREDAINGIQMHQLINDAKRKVKKTDASSAHWLINFKMLRTLIELHLDEEEDDIFPAIQHVLTDENRAMLLDNYQQERLQGTLTDGHAYQQVA